MISDIYKYEIYKKLDNKTLGSIATTSKEMKKYTVQELGNREMEEERKIRRRDRLAIINRDKKPFPEPKFEPGVPDFDDNGEPIPENIESNDEWLRMVMIAEHKPERYISEILDKLIPHANYLLANARLDDFLIKLLLPHVDDVTKVLEEANEVDVYIALRIYKHVSDIADEYFSKTGAFPDVVRYNNKTRSMFLKISYNLLKLLGYMKSDGTFGRVDEPELFRRDLREYVKKADLFEILEFGNLNYLDLENMMIIKQRIMDKNSYDYDMLYVTSILKKVYDPEFIRTYLHGFEIYIPILTEQLLEKRELLEPVVMAFKKLYELKHNYEKNPTTLQKIAQYEEMINYFRRNMIKTYVKLCSKEAYDRIYDEERAMEAYESR